MFARLSQVRPVTGLRLAAALFVGMLSVSAVGGCAKAPNSFKVPLEYHPSNNSGNPLTSAKIPPDGIYFEEVNDVRGKMEIGQSRQRKASVRVLAAGQEPTKFVGTAMQNHFMGAGARVVDQARRAGRVIQTELTQFWTQQDGNSRATVEAEVTVRDRKGQPLYQQTVTGSADSRASSLNAGAFQTLYSDATYRLVKNLLNDAEFRKALGPNAQVLAPKKAETTETADVSEGSEGADADSDK
jgi:hypothetical protein